jgi:hypothetical protein
MEIKLIKGLTAPILTPFDNNLNVDQSMYNDLAKSLIDFFCSGLAPFGTTGEALSVGNNERMNAIEGLVKSGIDPNKLIPGTGLCNLPDTIEITVKRNIYGGAVGYIGWNGNMDMAIAIRTAVIKDKILHVQAGGGVVADSEPELEWEETMNKARAVMRAAAMVSGESR